MSFLRLFLFSLASQAVVAAPSKRAQTLCPGANSSAHKVHNATFTIECGTDHYGGDMTEGYGQPAASFHACISRCAAQQGCLAAAYTNGDCFLKSTVEVATLNANVDSAVLRGPAPASGGEPSATPVQAHVVLSSGSSTTMLTTTTRVTITITETGSPPTSAPAAATPTAASPTAASLSAYQAGRSGCARPAAKGLGGKRGLCYNDASLTTFFGDKVTWAYNWGQTPDGSLGSGLEYIPMLWGGAPSVTGAWSGNAASAISSGSSVLLGFNEPDLSTQSDMTVADAVSAWQQFMEPLACDARLAAPAVTNGAAPMGLAWLSSFLESCDGCTVDVVPIHWYDSAENSAYFMSYVQQAHAAGGNRPIWITEFGASGSDQEVEAFFQTVLPWLDSQDYIERYSYFMDGENSLVNSAGTGLSDIGNAYNSI